MSAFDASACIGLLDRQRAHLPEVRRSRAPARAARLRRLVDAIRSRRQELAQALAADFGKPECESDLTEFLASLTEIKHIARHVGRWMKPRRVGTPLTLLGTRSEVRCEPKGVVLIIGPWNYPFYLIMAPLAAAIAAGNCVLIKPSELTPHTSALIARLVEAVFPPEEVAVVQGGREVAEALLGLPFDHIFFTGSTRVGKVVMQRAAERLTSVTLELGGKSPVIVDPSADLHETAARVCWGKFLNGGQTCIAPDYALVPEPLVPEFVSEFKQAVATAFGASSTAQLRTVDMARIVNDANFSRLRGLIDTTVAAGAKLELGGEYDAPQRRIAPTLLSGVTWDMPVMGEEIFGPILPVVAYRDRAELIERLRRMPKPLAVYVFSRDAVATEEFLRETSAGGSAVNTTILHVGNPNLPFGGDGESGMGEYHGREGFLAFSHQRAVLRQGWLDLTRLLSPPYGAAVKSRLAWMVRLFG